MVSQRFSYVRYDAIRADKQATFKGYFDSIEASIETRLAEGRHKSLCLTALEEAYMWVGKAIRNEQIEADGMAIEEAPDRGEEGVNVAPKPLFQDEAKEYQEAQRPTHDSLTAYALAKAAAEVPALQAAYGYDLHVVRKAPGRIDGHGLERLAMSIVSKGGTTPLRTFHVFSGAPGKQVFQKGGSSNVPRSLMPCPQGRYTVGKEEWLDDRKDDFNASWGPGLGPCFIAFDPTFATRRGSFGIHLDENHATAPGSAGCLVFETRAHFQEFLAAFRQYKPTGMVVDWGIA